MQTSSKIEATLDIEQFMQRLEHEAARQAALDKHSPLPESLQNISAFIARHVWQVSLVLAIVTAVGIEVFAL